MQCKLAGLPKGFTLLGLKRSFGAYLRRSRAFDQRLMYVLDRLAGVGFCLQRSSFSCRVAPAEILRALIFRRHPDAMRCKH